MSVIAHLRIPSTSFELGRILEMESGVTGRLENLVPLGEKAIPFILIHQHVHDAFEQKVSNHPAVDQIAKVSHHDDMTLYSLEWDVNRDIFFQGVIEQDAQLLSASGGEHAWEFELRFPTHDALGRFQQFCLNANIQLEVGRVYQPLKPPAGQWYGLTEAQRETLVQATAGGYYSIPREMSTQDLADSLQISDQAVTERLRRAIETLVENTLIAVVEEEAEFEPVE